MPSSKLGFSLISISKAIVSVFVSFFSVIEVYIPGYGYGVAADTAGAIKGNKIDLCYETRTEALNWGIKNITVYVVK